MRTRNLNAEIFGLRLGLNVPWTPAELAQMQPQAAQSPAVAAVPAPEAAELWPAAAGTGAG